MSFQGELMQLINRHNLGARYDIPDAVLAKYLCDCHAVLGENLVRLRLHEAHKTSEKSGAVDNRHTTGKIRHAGYSADYTPSNPVLPKGGSGQSGR